MTISKTKAKKPTQAMAIAGLILNIIVIPGLGSLINSKKEGVWQLVLFVIGIVVLFGIIFLYGFDALGIIGIVFAGILLLAAWVWGLVTGIHLVKEAK